MEAPKDQNSPESQAEAKVSTVRSSSGLIGFVGRTNRSGPPAQTEETVETATEGKDKITCSRLVESSSDDKDPF